MTLSMTAFARKQSEEPWGSLAWEIRSVNHRYLEPSLRLPEQLRSLEPAIRDLLRKKLSRGKVDCQLRFQPSEGGRSELAIDNDLVKKLKESAETIQGIAKSATPLAVADILKWPGVLEDNQIDNTVIEKCALALFREALGDLITSRAREGQELAEMIDARLIAISEIVLEVRSLLPDIMAKQRQNLLNRINEIQVELEPVRIEQEIALLAQKADVDEELDRLDAHVREVQRVLGLKEQKGRRLDFLMQELNREANTLSSKSIVTETTQCAVELKVLIEQMREQVQNIE